MNADRRARFCDGITDVIPRGAWTKTSIRTCVPTNPSASWRDYPALRSQSGETIIFPQENEALRDYVYDLLFEAAQKD